MAAADALGDELPRLPEPERPNRLRLLDQGDVWIPANGREIKIVDMSPGHVRSLIAWLDRRAPLLHMAACFESCAWVAGGDMANDALDRERTVLWDCDPKEWLHNTVLWETLAEREVYFYGGG